MFKFNKWQSTASVLTLMLLTGVFPESVLAAIPGIPAVSVATGQDGAQTYTLSLQVLGLMTALTFLPAALIMMTSFTRIIIVLAIIRQAVGLQSAPPNQILIGIALFLTFFIMAPVFNSVYYDSVEPYLDEKIEFQQALEKAEMPIRGFMMDQTRVADINMFSGIAGLDDEAAEKAPFSVLLPAFVTSELKTAFQIGFLVFIPFLIIDLVVASVLMAMGMMMLSPMIIALPFKIMLFVLVDGWTLLIGTLASSFYV